jgi:hypothetical protein
MFLIIIINNNAGELRILATIGLLRYEIMRKQSRPPPFLEAYFLMDIRSSGMTTG